MCVCVGACVRACVRAFQYLYISLFYDAEFRQSESTVQKEIILQVRTHCP